MNEAAIDENDKMHQDITAWIESVCQVFHAEQKCQHVARNFGDFSMVIMMSRNKDHGNLEITAYHINTKELESRFFETAPALFEEGW